jgi:16S rRNA (cytosine967-C5)-methyltransferase
VSRAPRRPRGSGVRSPARAAALNATLLARKRGLTLNQALEQVAAAEDLSDRDRRLAEEIACGTVRHRASLDSVLAEVSNIPLEKLQTAVLEALRGAVYQTFYLERIPEHAAVNEAVRLARSFGRGRAAGFANAVLRAALKLRAGRHRGTSPRPRASLYFRNDQVILLSRDLLPDPELDRAAWLAVHYSYPRWLVDRLLDEHGKSAAESVLKWGNEIPHTGARVNRLRCDMAKLAGADPGDLCAHGAVFAGCSLVRPGPVPGCYLIGPERNVGALPGIRDGLFSVQDPAQQRAAELLAPRPGEKILDLCAAPGGKTGHLAEISADRAEILACDPDGQRLELVAEAARRLGLSSVRTRRLRVPPLPTDLAAGFHAVLVDVPCSNTGAMNRRVESRWRARAEAVARMSEAQRSILTAGAEALRPGGRLVYATCSLLGAENGEVVRAVLESRPGLRLAKEELTLPKRGSSDGGYVALLEA